MRTFDVVGIDFELGLTVHFGLAGGAQIAVCLKSNRFVCALFHQYTAIEYSRRLIAQNILKQLCACTVRRRMGDMAIGVDLLMLIQYGHAAKGGCGMFAV